MCRFVLIYDASTSVSQPRWLIFLNTRLTGVFTYYSVSLLIATTVFFLIATTLSTQRTDLTGVFSYSVSLLIASSQLKEQKDSLWVLILMSYFENTTIVVLPQEIVRSLRISQAYHLDSPGYCSDHHRILNHMGRGVRNWVIVRARPKKIVRSDCL